MSGQLPTRATASAAATVSNLGPGFDVLGLCLDAPRDRVRAERVAGDGVTLGIVRGDATGALPSDPGRNAAAAAASAVLEAHGAAGVGLRLELDKGLPPGTGLGSSGASAVAGAVAAGAVLAPDRSRRALLDACREGERAAVGAPHPDNVAPALLGGVVAAIGRADGGIEPLRLSWPEWLHVAVARPEVSLGTAEGRAALPAAVPLADVVAQQGALTGLIVGLARGDAGLVGRSLDDRIATPSRKERIPGYEAAVAAARDAGALGAGISGSGPTVFALADGAERGKRAARAMGEAFEDAGRAATTALGRVDEGGARVESRS